MIPSLSSSSSSLPPHTWIPETYEQSPWLTFEIPSNLLNLIFLSSATSSSSSTTTITYGFYPLSIKYWLELIVGVTCMCCVASLTAIVLYHNIILPQQQRQREGQQGQVDEKDDEHERFIKMKLSTASSVSSSSSFSTTSTTRRLFQQQQLHQPPTYTQTLLVFGILWPFWLIFPSIVVKYFQITNLIFRFSIGVIVPTLSLFRSTQGT